MANPQSPGWYDDPESPQQLRYFDGVVWTRHTTPRSTRPTAGYGVTPQAGTGPGPTAPQAGPVQGGAPPQPWPPQQPQQPPYGQPGGWSAPPAPTAYGAVARTPDGEALAGWWKRVLARLIDWIIVWLLALPLTGYFLYRAGADLTPAFEDYFRQIESGNTSAVPPTVTPEMLKWVIAYSVILTLVAIAYEVFFTTRTGATPGKRALGLRVRLRERPGPLSLQTALTRTLIPMGGNLFSSVPIVSTFVSLLQLADSLLPLVNERKQALHDLMAKTNVVDTRRV